MSFRPYKGGAPYATTKDVVARLVDEAGGAKPSAFVLERRERGIYEYCDPDHDAQMSFDQVRRLTVATRSTAAAEMLAADAGGVFVPGERLGSATFSELAAQVCGEHGAFSAAVCRAFGDGRIEAGERAEVRRELDDLIRLAIAARDRLEADAPPDGGRAAAAGRGETSKGKRK